ncbi:MAG: hypothetical protein U0L76_04300 [Ruminococcus sp.]|nr:hypothetical protein [Ruminococcus sp.]
MNIANVTSRFSMLSGLSNSEIYKWRTLIEDACAYVETHLVKDDPDESDTKRIEMLSAVYALKLYSLCNDDNITSFTAGDVHITSPDSSKSRADRLWLEYSQKCADLIGTENFLFGVI